MKSNMKHKFSEVPRAKIPRSSFNRSHGLKTTFDETFLYPIFFDEALPGDTFNLNMTGFARMATPIHPVMDNLFMDTHFFAVPIRLLWSNWEKFNGEQDNPGDSTDFTTPVIQSGAGFAEGSLSDYLGLPTLVAGLEVSAFWHRAYNLIWNEWFRDQNLQNAATVPTGDGPDATATFPLRQRGKRHDYFTSCLPWPQKGNEVVTGLLGEAPITGLGMTDQTSFGAGSSIYMTDGTGSEAITDHMTGTLKIAEDASNLGFPDVRANLAAATGISINDLRQSFQIQKLLERDARGGTRYTEVIKSHFGVTSPDARMQRPEYLGGGTSAINITPVPQTSSTDATTPQGNLSGYGTAGMQGHGFVKSFTEHCVVLGLVSIRSDLTYQQGIDRMFLRSTRYDYYWPALAQIGEQEVTNKEIYADGSANDDLVFGYQERYGEMRYKQSKITGKMRSNATGSLESWHLSQEFGSLPVLGNTFIWDDPPVDRVLALPSEPHFIFDSFFDYYCARPLPVFGVPGLIDHF